MSERSDETSGLPRRQKHDLLEEIEGYWRTSITRVRPNEIWVRGYPIEQLIGNVTFPMMIWLLLRGNLPSAAEAALLEAALVASVDHGPHAPAISIARTAVSCGLPLNGAIASAVNALDDVHGGAGEAALDLFSRVAISSEKNGSVQAAEAAIESWIEAHGKHIPGFGHRFHAVDPRVEPLLKLVVQTAENKVVSGKILDAARAVETCLAGRLGRAIPMNIDGITAVVFGELSFPPPLARGLFCLSRSVGILAHAWEQTNMHERNKGPVPRSVSYRYDGPDRRNLESDPGSRRS